MEAWGSGGLYARLAAAIAAGLLLGLLPEARGRVAGLRTHLMVCVGATIFTLSARLIDVPAVDPLRVVQGIAAGVGFVGAASVLRRGGRVYGVTTAAQLWAAAAIGCEVGLGQPLAGLVMAGVLVLLNSGVGFLEARAWGPKDARRREDD